MSYLIAKQWGIALLMVFGMGASRQRAKPASASSSSVSTGAACQRDRTAKQFYDFGLRCLKGAPHFAELPILQQRSMASLRHRPGEPARVPLSQRSVPEKTRQILSMLYGADGDEVELKRARAKYPAMAEARRLYLLLADASPTQQSRWAEAFSSGFLRAAAEFQDKEEQDQERRRAAERQRLASHRRLTRELLAHTADRNLEEAVMDYAINKIGERWDHDYEIVSGLPTPVQLVFAMRRMSNEIEGDGLAHLTSCDSWRFAALATEGYRLIGSAKRASVMERATAVIAREKVHPTPPPDDEVSDQSNPALAALDD
jgi:hypothetical protein